MELDFRDIVTGARVPSPDDGTYSIVELTREHRERYVFQTKAGAIILRRLPLRLYRLIQSQRLRASKTIGALVAEFEQIAERVQSLPDEDISKEDRDRINDIADQLAYSDYSALGVIESPQILTMEDYDELLSKLDDDERTVLFQAVQELSSIRDYETVDPTEQILAEKLGIKTIDETVYGLMTVGQSAYWASRFERENEEIRRQQERYGGFR